MVGDAPAALLDLPQSLAAIISGDERWVAPWLRTVALYMVAQLPPASQRNLALRQAVATQAAAADPLVRETATWVLAALNGTQVDTARLSRSAPCSPLKKY